MAIRPRRFLLYSLTAIVPAIGLLAGATISASASTTSAATQAKALAVAAIKDLQVGQHSQNHQVGASKSSRTYGLSQVESTNWSGYADTGSGFSKVSATWTEPSASCSGRTESLAAFWVGIDGYSSDTVEQDGTLIECYRGAAYQYSWWELYPTNDIQVVGESVAAGDAISASVVRSGSSYTLAVTDSTHTANSFSKTETSTGDADSSAEWIAEAPSGSGGVYPLADFKSWTAANASVTEGSTTGTISSFTDDEITMVTSSRATEARPGALNSAGTSFGVTWERS